MKKEIRIKKSHEIASIVKSRNKVTNNNFVIYFQKNELNVNRFAVSVSKKIGKAHIRNKVKRITRNIFRDLLNDLTSTNIIVIAKNDFNNVSFETLKKEARFLIKLINKKQGVKLDENKYL